VPPSGCERARRKVKETFKKIAKNTQPDAVKRERELRNSRAKTQSPRKLGGCKKKNNRAPAKGQNACLLEKRKKTGKALLSREAGGSDTFLEGRIATSRERCLPEGGGKFK